MVGGRAQATGSALAHRSGPDVSPGGPPAAKFEDPKLPEPQGYGPTRPLWASSAGRRRACPARPQGRRPSPSPVDRLTRLRTLAAAGRSRARWAPAGRAPLAPNSPHRVQFPAGLAPAHTGARRRVRHGAAAEGWPARPCHRMRGRPQGTFRRTPHTASASLACHIPALRPSVRRRTDPRRRRGR